MREHPRFRYLEWIKDRSARARISLAESGVPTPDLAALEVDVAAMPLDLEGAGGWPPLQRALARAYGVTEDEVLVTPSCTYANHLAFRTLFAPGDRVVVERPTYELLERLIQQAGAEAVPVRRDLARSYATDWDAVEAALGAGAAGVALTSPHNPSGALLDRFERARIGRLAREHAVPVIVDEIYLDACLDAGFKSHYAAGGGVVATGGLTKVYGLGGLRVGWVLASPERIDAMRVLHDQIADRVASLSARIAAHVLDEPRRGRLRAVAEGHRAEKLALVRDLVARVPRLELRDPGFGITVLCVVDRGEADTLALAEELLERDGVLLVPGEMFGERGTLRIGLGRPAAALAEGLAALERALLGQAHPRPKS